jgi:hypothetical protein
MVSDFTMIRHSINDPTSKLKTGATSKRAPHCIHAVIRINVCILAPHTSSSQLAHYILSLEKWVTHGMDIQAPAEDLLVTIRTKAKLLDPQRLHWADDGQYQPARLQSEEYIGGGHHGAPHKEAIYDGHMQYISFNCEECLGTNHFVNSTLKAEVHKNNIKWNTKVHWFELHHSLTSNINQNIYMQMASSIAHTQQAFTTPLSRARMSHRTPPWTITHE